MELRLGGVRVGECHVSRLWRKRFDYGLDAHFRGDHVDHLPQGYGPIGPEIEEFEALCVAPCPIECAEDPRYDVVDVRVVACGTPIPEHRDFASLPERSRKLVDGEVWALPGSVHGEEPETRNRHVTDGGGCVTKKLRGALRGGVRGDRGIDPVDLGE